MLPALPTGMARIVGRAAQVVADLEGGGLLALEAERVDRVDQGDRMVVLLGERADDPERVVEVAVDRHHPRPGDQRLEQLADGDLALGQDDDARPCRRRRRTRRRTPTCSRSRRRRSPSRPASAALATARTMPRSLNEPVGFWPSILRYRLGQSERGAEPGRVHQRRRPFAEGQRRRVLRDRQESPVAFHEARPPAGGARRFGHQSSTG